MAPPAALLKASARLNLDEFASQFAAAWSRLNTRFLKVECWQEYQELEAAESQNAYDRGDIESARDLMEREAEADRPLYADVRRRGIDYARIRLLRLPLTRYLEYEMIAYSIRIRMGENIEVVKLRPTAIVPSADYFDFLLFDWHTALIHDYGSGGIGIQSGGWVTHDSDAISMLEEKALALRVNGIPLMEFLAQMENLQALARRHRSVARVLGSREICYRDTGAASAA
jgi:hypothetical protein